MAHSKWLFRSSLSQDQYLCRLRDREDLAFEATTYYDYDSPISPPFSGSFFFSLIFFSLFKSNTNERRGKRNVRQFQVEIG